MILGEQVDVKQEMAFERQIRQLVDIYLEPVASLTDALELETEYLLSPAVLQELDVNFARALNRGLDELDLFDVAAIDALPQLINFARKDQPTSAQFSLMSNYFKRLFSMLYFICKEEELSLIPCGEDMLELSTIRDQLQQKLSQLMNA